MIQAFAEGGRVNIWPYINPNTDTPINVPIAPVKPQPSQYYMTPSTDSSPATTPSTDSTLVMTSFTDSTLVTTPSPTEITASMLTRDQKEDYRWDVEEYYREKAKYQDIPDALAEIRERILITISPSNIIFLKNKKTEYEMLRSLRFNLSPSTHFEEDRAISVWQKAQIYTKNEDILEWSHRFHLAYTDMKALDLPDVSGSGASLAFIAAIAQYDRLYSLTRLSHLRDDNSKGPDLVRSIVRFREHVQLRRLQSSR